VSYKPTCAGPRLVVPVIVGVMLASLFRMIIGVGVVALRHVRVMTGRLVVATLVVVRCRLMVLGGMLVMLSGFAMMFRGFL